MRPLETRAYDQTPIPNSRKEVLDIRKNRFFTLTGTLLFKRFVSTGGDLISRYIPGRKIRDYNEEGLKKTFLFVNCLEAIHWVGFTIATGVSIYVLSNGKTDVALQYSLINILFNVHPLLLQRYNRLRLNHALDRYRRLRVNNDAKSFPPSPEGL